MSIRIPDKAIGLPYIRRHPHPPLRVESPAISPKCARGNGFFLVTEQDGSDYYHLNFLAQDKNVHSRLFFGEIKVRIAPKDEDVTCCCPVSPFEPGTLCTLVQIIHIVLFGTID